MTTAKDQMLRLRADAARLGETPVSWQMTEEAVASLLAETDAHHFVQRDPDAQMTAYGLPIATIRGAGQTVLLVSK